MKHWSRIFSNQGKHKEGYTSFWLQKGHGFMQRPKQQIQDEIIRKDKSSHFVHLAVDIFHLGRKLQVRGKKAELSADFSYVKLKIHIR